MPSYDRRAALVVVDVQNDFADPHGSLAVPGGEAIIEEVNAQVALARAGGSPVVYTQDWHPPQTPHFSAQGGLWPAHCVRETWGAAMHPRLVITGETVRKGEDGSDGYSAFTARDPVSGDTDATDLDRMLRVAGVERIVVVGLATDYCIVETACDARMLTGV